MEFVPAKTIVANKKDTSWFGTEYNMNIYRGCSHGCIYCDSRSDCYRVEDFDRVRAKENALEIIRNELRRKKSGVIATGAMSDPYNPMEKQYELTRHALELINAYEFGIAIATKSDLVLRDMDILSEIKEHSPVLVKVTITTADDALSKIVEPYVASSDRRFAVLQKLSQAGIFCGVLLMPVLPFLEDNGENIEAIVKKVAEVGGRFIYPAFGMTMRDSQREHYYNKLDEHFPGLRQKYEKAYGLRYTCTSKNAKALWARFTTLCNQYGILYDMQEIVSAYRMGYERQLRFF